MGLNRVGPFGPCDFFFLHTFDKLRKKNPPAPEPGDVINRILPYWNLAFFFIYFFSLTFFFISIDKNGRVRVSIVDFERVDGPRVGDLAKEFRPWGRGSTELGAQRRVPLNRVGPFGPCDFFFHLFFFIDKLGALGFSYMARYARR